MRGRSALARLGLAVVLASCGAPTRDAVPTRNGASPSSENGSEAESASDSETGADSGNDATPATTTAIETTTEVGSSATPEPDSAADAPPAPDAPVLTLAHRVTDGRIFAELPGGEALEAPVDASVVCRGCSFELWAHTLGDAPTGEHVTIVRPDGTTCEGQLGETVALGVLDPANAPTPLDPADASWRRAALVSGCRGTDELFLVAAHGEARPVSGLVRPLDPPARRAARDARRRNPGSSEVEVWRFGTRMYVRTRRCSGTCSEHDVDEFWDVYADGGAHVDEPEDFYPPDLCCELVTGLIDLDGDGEPTMIDLSGYPEDADWVWLTVGPLHVQLASDWYH